MRILVSNDDGHRALGIRCLAAVLGEIAEVQVVAPDRNRSGASNSLTIDVPLRPRTAANGFVYVDGTPTDCVHLAITGLLDSEPDIVVSGINCGANLGDDVLYSGTVAAAMEGRHLGMPAIAVSLVVGDGGHYETAARVVREMLENVGSNPLPAATVLNVNVPDCPWSALRGLRVTRLGHRQCAQPAVRTTDPRGEGLYWVGAPGAALDAGAGTDFAAVREGYVSVTPLDVDLTCHRAIEGTAAWLGAVER